MGKDVKENKDRSKYDTTQQTETYRQQANKESKILAAKTKADIEKLDPYFSINNNYLALYKQNPEKRNEDAVNFEHPVDQLGNVDYNYCQRCKKDKKFCPHKNKERLEEQKTQLKFPVTSAQQVGWRKPIDDTNFGYGIKSTMQIFTNSFRSQEKPAAEKK